MTAIELALAEDRGDTPCEPAISRTCDRCGEWLHTDDVRRFVCGYCLAEAEGEALLASICALDAHGCYP